MNTNGLDLVQERTDPFVRTLAGRRVMGSSARIWRLNDELSTPRLPGAGYLRDLLHQPGRVLCFRVVFLLRRICRFDRESVNDASRPPLSSLSDPRLVLGRLQLRPHALPPLPEEPPVKMAPLPPPSAFIPRKKMSFLTRLAAVAGTCFQSFGRGVVWACRMIKLPPYVRAFLPSNHDSGFRVP
ncbi:hypothetical protein OPV22_029361 [Ensete ventricosum]|uniref:Uncharacterized protein n=1 Tax=Ensete ventricosum TaxID=4639 RepID=A0AAV8QDB4_ENSVE|nr:hypothetical protein OPV22_029361 [Ensete ventricosum]